MNSQNDHEQTKSLLSYQNVRTILSLAYIDSKIPKSTLMKIEIKQVLETVNNEIELLVFRNGGNFLCAISRILQKKCALLMQELRDFYDNFKNKGLAQQKKGPNQASSRKNRTLLRTAILDADSNLFNTSTASIEELSNQSIQNPRNIASKDKITMPSIITPFRAQPPELVGSSNLLTNDKFSEELTINSGVADLLGAKSSLIKTLDHDVRKSPNFAQGEEADQIPMINVFEPEQSEQESNISVASNLPVINDRRIGEIAETVRNNESLSFRERIEKSKNQSEKKQRHKNFFDEEIELKGESVASNLNQDFQSIHLEEDDTQNETADSLTHTKEISISFHKMPENLLKKSVLDKIANNLSKVSLSDNVLEQDHPKFAHSEKKNLPFKFSLDEDVAIRIEEDELAGPNQNEEEGIHNEEGFANEGIGDGNFEPNNEDFREMGERSKFISPRKSINRKEDSVNQKLLKVIQEMSEERRINDFDRLYFLTKDSYSKAQLFVELLELMRQDMIIINQNSFFGKITFGLI